MKSRAASLIGILFILSVITVLAPAPAAAGVPGSVEPAHTPALMFIENMGQFAEGARYKVHGADRAFWLADDAIWITLREPAPSPTSEDAQLPEPFAWPDDLTAEAPRKGVHLRLTFPGANPQAELSAYQPVDTTISYFLGNDPEQWRPDVPVWAGVRYRDLYPGLDLAWDSSTTGAPGMRLICRAGDCAAALAQVQMRVEGADALMLDGDALRISTAVGAYRLPLLRVTDAAGEPLSPEGLSLHVQGDTATAPFTAPLAALPVIPTPAQPADDPGDLLYSTFLGGIWPEEGNSLALDAAGHATVTGYTYSDDFPTTPGAFDTGIYQADVFVTRLNVAGSALRYSTFLGGNGGGFGYDEDRGFALAVDAAGNAVVTGRTDSPDFPTTPGAYDTSFNGYRDAFVTRLNSTGSALLYSTFLGGRFYDTTHSLALDTAGNAVLTGETLSWDFPTTPGAYDTSYNGAYLEFDVFVTRLNAAGSALLYSTFLGGIESETGLAAAVDAAGNAVVTGYTYSTDFPTTPGAYDTSFSGGFYDYEVFVTRLNAAGSALLYSTFLGGNDEDRGLSLALDAAGNATLTGWTESADFPTTPGAFDRVRPGERAGFVTRLNVFGSALIYSTFLGGSAGAGGGSVALDAQGNAVVIGSTGSDDFPTTPGAFDTSYAGPLDVFVTRLNVAGSALMYSTFLGGSDWDEGKCVALDAEGHAVVTGFTLSADFPTTPAAFDTSYNGEMDTVVAKLRLHTRLVLLPIVSYAGE